MQHVVHQPQFRYAVYGRVHQDVQTRRAHYQHRYQHHDSDIGSYLVENRARLLHVPYLVESGLYRLEERIDGPEQYQQADTDEEASLGCVQIALHHRHDGRHQVGLA